MDNYLSNLIFGSKPGAALPTFNGAPAVDPYTSIMQSLVQPQAHAASPGLNIGGFADLLNPPQRHLGMSGMPLNPDGSDPADPFKNGFFKSGAATMSPATVAASQGPTAANQWANPGMYPGFAGLIHQSTAPVVLPPAPLAPGQAAGSFYPQNGAVGFGLVQRPM